MNNQVKYSSVLVAVCLALLLLSGIGKAAKTPSSPLLLSLDVERDSDVDALKKLNLTVPATYFVTGEFARKYPEQVRMLAQTGTIGSHSHSHPNLTQLALKAVKEDLLHSMRAIESATGKSPIWFRAPFLEMSDEVLAVAKEIGFKYDSSETERWVKQGILSELPISINTTGRILFSDYDIFSVYGVDDEMALDMLKENYLSRLEIGRPFVFLLHPSMIVEHTEVIHQFIDFVHEQGGSCLSFDQYLKRMFQDSPVDIGIRIDPSIDGLMVEQVVEDLTDLNITDAFILARDRAGNKFYHADPRREVSFDNIFRQLTHELHQAGIRVYAELPVLTNEYAIQQVPDLAMIDGNGKASKVWVSPSHPLTHDDLEQYVSELLKEPSLHGIHLNALEYPDMHADFSPAAVSRFQQDTGVGASLDKAPSVLPGKHYSEWINWRFQQLGNVIQTVAAAASRERPGIVISASLNSDSLVDFESMESSGQNSSLLARDLDIIATAPDYSVSDSLPTLMNRLLHMSRTMVGDKPLFIGMPRAMSDVDIESGIDDLAKMIRAGAEGIVFPSYHRLLTSGGEERRSNIGEIKEVIDLFQKPVTESMQRVNREFYGFVEQAKASLPPTEYSKLHIMQESNQENHGKIVQVPHISLLGFLFVLASLLVYTKVKRDSDVQQQAETETEDLFDATTAIEAIRMNSLTGPMVHSVALFLREFDPVSASRFRTAYILDLVAESKESLTVQKTMKLTADIPGWQVLAMSYIKEAIMHNYLSIDHDNLTITPEGMQELNSLKAEGYNSKQWLFVEERFHEILHVTCPQCKQENSTHWYWTNFTCRRCNKEIELTDCSEIHCRSMAGIELNQFNII